MAKAVTVTPELERLVHGDAPKKERTGGSDVKKTVHDWLGVLERAATPAVAVAAAVGAVMKVYEAGGWKKGK